MHRAIAILAALVAVMAYGNAPADEPAAAAAPAGVGRSQLLSNRVVRVFDFEERKLGNFERMPRDWFVHPGPGFPQHTADRTGFDKAHAVSGEYALKLELNGGSAAATLQRGTIAAVPGADYIVTARCRTERLTHARARLVAWFVDQHGRQIDGSRAASPLHAGNGRWTRLEARLRGDFDNAAWVVLHVELLQPEQFRPAVLGEHELFHQDIGGAAWFDDITLYQLPRVEIAPQRDTHVIRGDRPELSLTVRDLTGEPLRVQAVVRDHVGRPVDTQSRTLDGRHASHWRWRPGLGRFGWYWADLAVRSGDRLVGRRACAFAWLPAVGADGVGGGEAHRFGIVAERMTAAQREMLVKMLPTIGSGALIVDLWRADTTDDQLDALRDEFDPTLNRLIGMDQRLTVSISAVPAPLARLAGTDSDRPVAVLAGDPAVWQPYLRSAAARYGQRVSRWQVGGVGNTEPATRAGFADEYAALRRWLGDLVPDARLAVPWSALRQVDDIALGADALTMRVPASVRPDRIADYCEAWRLRDSGRPDVALALEALPVDRFDHERRAEDLLLRLVHAWRAQPSTVYIDHPWRVAADGSPTATPDPLLAVFAGAIDRLAGRRFVGEMAIGDGLRCYILDSPNGGALVAWNESSPDPSPTLALQLGNEPVAVDMWGNRTPLAERGGRHVLALGAAPVFVEGINAKLARLRAGLRFDPAFVETSASVHALTLHVTNPWPRAVAGKLRLFADEDGWAFQPGLIRLNLGAGQSVELPVELTMPISAYAGHKTIRGRLQLDAGERFDIDVALPLEVGLRDVEYRASLRLEGGDAVVTATITNRGDTAAGYYAFARAPDRAMKQRIVARLRPGETTTKRFTFADADALSGRSLRVGLRQLDGAGVLTQRLDVP